MDRIVERRRGTVTDREIQTRDLNKKFRENRQELD
jgi:hypothetical protein